MEVGLKLPVVQSGLRLGPYRILAKIGAGGMGEVYQATDTRLNRRVAVKILRSPHPTSPASRARLWREARLAAKLSHPHICALFDIGEDEGHIYLVMECLQGETLADRLSRGRLPLAGLVGYGIEVADALEAAHRQGLIHRDVKPANIMLTDVGAKLLDFGVAELHDPSLREALEDTTRTHVGHSDRLAGTIAYMAPEQLEGRPCDPRTDLFALGTVLFEMATGRRPHQGQTTLALVTSILHDPPTRLRRLRGEVPGAFEHLVQWALAKDQTNRPPSAAVMATELRHIARRLDPAVPRARKLAPATKRASLESIRRLAVLPLTNLSGDPEQEYFADGMTDAIISSLARLGSLKVISRTSVVHYKRSSKSLPEIAEALRVDAILEGSVAKCGDRVRVIAELVQAGTDAQLWSASFNRQLDDALHVQDDVARGIAGQIRLKLSEGERSRLNRRRRINREAREHYLLGSYLLRRYDRDSSELSLNHLRRAIELEPGFADAHAALADWHQRAVVGHMSAPSGLARAVEAAEHALALDPDMAEAYAALGYARLLQWDFAGADDAFVRALELKPSYPEVHTLYARYHLYRCDFEAALRETAQALELDPLSVRTLIGAATVQWVAGRLDDALQQCDRALELEPACAPAFLFRGMVHVRRKQWDAAVASLLRSRELAPDQQAPLSGLGYAYGRAGRSAEALAILSEVRQMRDESDPASTSIGLAEVFMGLGDEVEAMAHLEIALAARVPELLGVACDPLFEPLRSNPRFLALVRAIGLPIK
jgi:eukaryotic-like serine/threonine-protein kinase